MIVKICGLMSPLDSMYANMAGPDMIGLVFHRSSRRCLTPEKAKEVTEMLGDITKVGVFVDEDPEFIAKLVNEGIIDMVQVHGTRDEQYVKRIREAVGVPMIRAFIVKTKEDVEYAASCESDYIMLDSGMGTGRTMDWSLLEDADFPYILSGGLTPSNVLEAVRRLHPMGVDVSSGVETDGRKDPTKMTTFVYAARGDFEPLIEHHRGEYPKFGIRIKSYNFLDIEQLLYPPRPMMRPWHLLAVRRSSST